MSSSNIFASNKLPWSFSPTLCLPMSDLSYDPFGTNTQDLIEETVVGSFGRVTLYCKYGCCGDSKNAACCTEEQTVDADGLETYKLVSIVAAGIAGLCMLTVGILYIVKNYMKKRRLIRDINSINQMNNMKDITKAKVGKYQKNNGRGNFSQKNDNFFKKSKKTPNAFRQSTHSTAILVNEKPPVVPVNIHTLRPLKNIPANPINYTRPNNGSIPTNHVNISPSNGYISMNSVNPTPSNGYISMNSVNPTPSNGYIPMNSVNPTPSNGLESFEETTPLPPPVFLPTIPPPAVYEDVLFNNNSFDASNTGPRLPTFGTGTLMQ